MEAIKINNDENLFKIMVMDMDLPYYTCKFGDKQDNILVIKIDKIAGFVLSVECYKQNILAEDNLDFPDVEIFDKVLGVGYNPKSFNDEDLENCGAFNLVFNSQELDIILSNQLEEPIYDCYINGRVECYINRNNCLAYIRVRNLTPEEYSILQSQKKNFSR